MLDVLDSRDLGLRERLRSDTFATLEAMPDVAVQLIPETDADDRCGVSGAYLSQQSPPVLAVGDAVSAGRRSFTALHELGHHLQQTTPAAADALARVGDGGLALEDAACDSFAATILLPDELTTRLIPDGKPTALDAVALWRGSTASRAAVCVKIGGLLTGPGHVLLLDDTGCVSSRYARGLPPVRRGSYQGDSPVISDALTAGGASRSGRTRLTYRDGIRGEELYVQTARMDRYLVAVLTLGSPPWERFRVPDPENRPQGRPWNCENCHFGFASFDPPCQRCRAPICPECGLCSCQPRSQRQCPQCFQLLPEAAFLNGASRCTECDS